ncbi:hypothetical protein ACFX2J_012990 [Malus domestica]
MIACLSASTTWAYPLESKNNHGLTPSPFFPSPPAIDMPRPGIAGRVGSGQSCLPLGLWPTGWVVTRMRDSHHCG